MHGQLGKTDIHRVQRYLRVGDAAQRRTACHIRPVGVPLEGHARLFAHRLKQRRRHCVGGVALAGVILDDHAAVHPHGVVPVGVFRMVGVYPVGIVAGQQKAAGRHGAQCQTQPIADTLQRLRKEGGSRALLRLAAHLLIVKQTVDAGTAALLRRQEALQRREGALQIVQSGRGDIVPPRHAGLGIIEKQVVGQQSVLRHSCRLGDPAAEAALFAAVQRLHVHGKVILHAVVGVPVHVDGHVGDQRCRLPQIHQTHGPALSAPCPAPRC